MLTRSKRLGLLVPPGNNVIENDFRHWMPDSVDMHANIMHCAPDTGRDPRQGLLDLGENVEEPVRVLTLKPIEVVAFGCTGGSFLKGRGYDREIARRMEAASGGAKAVVTATAVVSALKSLGVKRVAACSPYEGDIEFLNEDLCEFYSDAGFEIVSFAADRRGLGESDEGPPRRQVAVELARRVDRPEAEAVFMSCTGFMAAADAIDELEDELGKPVVTSNQATFWACMQEIGIEESIAGGGQLLRQPVPALQLDPIAS